MSKMEFVFKSKGMPASNNPDDIPQLQALSRPALTPNPDPNPKPQPQPQTQPHYEPRPEPELEP
jgi:hypothetical protein